MYGFLFLITIGELFANISSNTLFCPIFYVLFLRVLLHVYFITSVCPTGHWGLCSFPWVSFSSLYFCFSCPIFKFFVLDPCYVQPAANIIKKIFISHIVLFTSKIPIEFFFTPSSSLLKLFVTSPLYSSFPIDYLTCL